MGLKTQICVFMNEKFFRIGGQQFGLKFLWLLRNERNYFLSPKKIISNFSMRFKTQICVNMNEKSWGA